MFVLCFCAVYLYLYLYLYVYLCLYFFHPQLPRPLHCEHRHLVHPVFPVSDCLARVYTMWGPHKNIKYLLMICPGVIQSNHFHFLRNVFVQYSHATAKFISLNEVPFHSKNNGVHSRAILTLKLVKIQMYLQNVKFSRCSYLCGLLMPSPTSPSGACASIKF